MYQSLITSITVIALLSSTIAFAEGSARHSELSLQHGINASAQGAAGSAQIVSGASSVPLGASAAVSGTLAEELSESAQLKIGDPLPIGDAVVSAGPAPNEALQQSTAVDE